MKGKDEQDEEIRGNQVESQGEKKGTETSGENRCLDCTQEQIVL